MSEVYFDSAIVAKLYTAESNSAQAAALVSGYRAPYFLTPWQELEVRNALRLKVFRGEITNEQLRQSLAALESDMQAGRWERPQFSVSDVQRGAERLSAKHATSVGCRTLDILHVAAAVVIGAKEFVTFDSRQGALAKKAGLKVRP